MAPTVLEVDGAAEQLRRFEQSQQRQRLVTRPRTSHRFMEAAAAATAAGLAGLATGIWL